MAKHPKRPEYSKGMLVWAKTRELHPGAFEIAEIIQ